MNRENMNESMFVCALIIIILVVLALYSKKYDKHNLTIDTVLNGKLIRIEAKVDGIAELQLKNNYILPKAEGTYYLGPHTTSGPVYMLQDTGTMLYGN